MGLWPSTPAKEEPSQSTTGNIDALVDLRIAHPPAREAREDTGQNKEHVDQAAGGTMSPMLEPLQPPPLYVTHMVRSCIESSCLTSGSAQPRMGHRSGAHVIVFADHGGEGSRFLDNPDAHGERMDRANISRCG